jgi:DNA-directed RNA polymerase specialized sigma24 family protein
MSQPLDAMNEGKEPSLGMPVVGSHTWKPSFPTTMWTCIERAQGGDRAAIAELACRYGTPVFCYFRAHGVEREAAKDLTGDFFLKLASGQFLEHLKPRVFRFRSFLKRSLAHMMVDAVRRKDAEKRGGRGAGLACLDAILERAQHLEPAAGESPETVLDRECAFALLAAVILRVRCECEQDGLSGHFECFADRFLTDPPLSWTTVGAKCGLSADAARERARTVQARFEKTLVEEICEPGMTDADIDDEIGDLIRAFQRSPKRHW